MLLCLARSCLVHLSPIFSLPWRYTVIGPFGPSVLTNIGHYRPLLFQKCNLNTRLLIYQNWAMPIYIYLSYYGVDAEWFSSRRFNPNHCTYVVCKFDAFVLCTFVNLMELLTRFGNKEIVRFLLQANSCSLHIEHLKCQLKGQGHDVSTWKQWRKFDMKRIPLTTHYFLIRPWKG